MLSFFLFFFLNSQLVIKNDKNEKTYQFVIAYNRNEIVYILQMYFSVKLSPFIYILRECKY
jgi:hypothetical protein